MIGGAFAVGIGAIVLAGLAFAAFVAALTLPATKGHTRCLLQETFYTQSWDDAPAGTPIIAATLVTEPVRDMCDAADDPAVLVEEDTLLVLGTNKQRSLNVYDGRGALIAQADDLGAPNNVDLRRAFGRVIAIASDKDESELEAFELDTQSGTLSPLSGAPFPAVAEEELYGVCLYQAGETLYVFTTDKSGLIVQYALLQGPEAFSLRKVRELRVQTQPEGCVVDDQSASLFVGEEDVGISSQGDNTYAVFDRASPHAFRGRFQVAYEGELIGDTDGLDVTSDAIGGRFPKGVLVVQDGFIRTGGKEGAESGSGERRFQRFAYVSWEAIEAALGL